MVSTNEEQIIFVLLLITIRCICRFFYIFFKIYKLNKKLTYTPCYVLVKKLDYYEILETLRRI